MDDSPSSTSAAPPPKHSVLDTIQTKLSPGVLLIVAILAMVFFIFGLLNLLVQNILRLRRARRRRLRVGAGDVDGSSPTALQGQLQQLFHLHDAGVDQAFIDTLPVFVYRAILGARAGKGKDDDPFDCAVCLCEFGMDDALRLLPTCGHAFHVPCIDAWLLSHSTCPLCRGRVLAADLSPVSSPVVLVLESEVSHADTPTDSDAPGRRDNEGSPKVEEEVVEVKLGKLRCVDGIGHSGELAVEATSRNDLGRRRCLSMGSYEYVTDEHVALRVAIKTPKKQRPRSRRRHALSESDFKKGALETSVKEAAAPAGDGVHCGEGAAAASRLSKDSFSISKIWMVPPAKREDGRKLASGKRSLSFRWPAMAQVSRNDGGNEEQRDVESLSGSFGSNGVRSLAEERPPFERPPFERTAPLWVAGGWQPSSSGGSHS